MTWLTCMIRAIAAACCATHLRGAVCGAAEVAWSVIAVGLVLWLQADALGAVDSQAVVIHTADCAILQSIPA